MLGGRLERAKEPRVTGWEDYYVYSTATGLTCARRGQNRRCRLRPHLVTERARAIPRIDYSGSLSVERNALLQ